MAYPQLAKALEIFDDYMNIIRSRIIECKGYDLHCITVAYNAQMLASHIPGMNMEKAFVLGLLHDYGEIVSAIDKNAFHGTSGYYLMQEMEFDDVARICLSHTFPNPDFEVNDYVYPKEELIKAKALLSMIKYDDYDRLIQLSDSLVRDYKNVTLRSRLVYVKEKYGITTAALKKKYREALRLKQYFDRKCHNDIYKILRISDAKL